MSSPHGSLLTTVGVHRQAGKWMWAAIAVAAVAGTTLWWVLSVSGHRAGLSYLGGLLLAVVAFEFGVLNIKVIDRIAPNLTLAAAMFSYALTALAFGLVLAASSPRVVDATAISTGLFAGLAIWLAGLITRSWVRQERADGAVNIVLHDDLPTNSS
jgi:hypothetical protein